MRLGTGRDKTGLDEKLLFRPRLCRNLEVDHLSPFIDVRLCLASPGSCERKKKTNQCCVCADDPSTSKP